MNISIFLGLMSAAIADYFDLWAARPWAMYVFGVLVTGLLWFERARRKAAAEDRSAVCLECVVGRLLDEYRMQYGETKRGSEFIERFDPTRYEGDSSHVGAGAAKLGIKQAFANPNSPIGWIAMAVGAAIAGVGALFESIESEQSKAESAIAKEVRACVAMRNEWSVAGALWCLLAVLGWGIWTL